MSKTNNTPRISVNKLGEYMVSKAARRQRILRDAKYPPPYITTYYREAQESIAQFIAGNMEDIGTLERSVQILEQKTPDSIHEIRRVNGNVEAIESFMNLIDEIDLKGADTRLGDHSPPKLKIMNVEVSVRPDIILTGTGAKGKTLVGGIKLHFPKTNPLNEDACGYISSAVQMHCVHSLASDGLPNPKYCMTVDIASGKVYEGVTAITQRKKDIEAACHEIASLWPGITN